MEGKDKLLESAIGGLDQKISSLIAMVKMILNREKEATEGEASELNQTPILPTPPPHYRLQPALE